MRVLRVHRAIPPFARLRDHSSIPISVCEAAARGGSTGRPNTRPAAALPWTGASCARVLAIASLLLICAVPYGAAVADSGAAAVRAVTQTSNQFAAFVDEASERLSVPVNWIGSVINIESVRDVHARSPEGAMGLMQIMPATWAELRERYNLGSDPYDPRDNILAGTAYLRKLLDRYGSPARLPRTMRDQFASKSIPRRPIARRDASVCGQAFNSAWHRVASDVDYRPAVICSCNVVRRAIRSDENTRSVVGAHSFGRRHDRNLGAQCFARGTPAYWHVRPSIGFGSVAMTRCAGSQAMACFSEQFAEGGEQWANTT